ncbi:signal peptidase I [Sporosarcina sp. FA9]|uniref:signal peptidase I n=1 Tax=Sporosarcina sp. FA9 TaxID=3413030 RepID=UPI003F655470
MNKYLLMGMVVLLTACSPEVASNKMETITDNDTKPEVELVEPLESSLLLEWHSDNMNRGNHDYEILAHPRLVVDPDDREIKRGDVIFFKSPDFTIESNPHFNMPENYISRVVGLPGEIVEIKDGQVFIDDKKLDTFYSKLLWAGMNEKEFHVKRANRGDDEATKKYFATTMEPVKVEENTIFVLSDNGARGVDSRDFGVLPMNSVEGKILGYLKTDSKSTVKTRNIIDKSFVLKNAKIGLTQEKVEMIFGQVFVSGFEGNIETWMYDNVKNNYNYEQTVETVAFKEIKDENVKSQLFINFNDGKAIMYSYFYKGDDGKVWMYELNPDKTITEIAVSK